MAESKRPDSKGLAFFDITDFSPGIFDASNLASGQQAEPLFAPGPFPAPPGAADGNGTYGCMALPGGGLGPLPGLNSSVASLSEMGISATGGADICCLINSFHVSDDELVIGVTQDIAGGFQTTNFYSWLASINSLNHIQGQTYNYLGDHNLCCFPFTSTIDGQPVVVLPLAARDGPNSNLMVYPSISTPGTFSVDVIEQNASADGTAFGHQGRIVVQAFLQGTNWPVPVNDYANELFNYTDPPQTETWPIQAESFGPENPNGYGAVNSVSAGELFCVKSRGGAVIIQGDLNNPTVTPLPGVKETGAIFGRSDTGTNGIYYCSANHGAWVWNGGNVSQKVSNQLDDNFYLPLQQIASPFYTYFCQRWGEWMLFSNNWLLNEATGAWWRLSDPATYSWYWYVPGYSDLTMYAALGGVTGAAQPFLGFYNRSTPAKFYTWQSLPIRLPTEDRLSDIREVAVRASNPYSDTAPTVTVTLINADGSSSVLGTQEVPSTNAEPVLVRFNAGVKSEFVAVNVSCTGAVAPPIVHMLSIGYRTREHAGLAN